MPVRVLTFNVKIGSEDYVAFSAYVADRRPDIVLLQEARANWLTDSVLRDYPFKRHSPRNLIIASRFPILDDGLQPAESKDAPALRALVDIGLKEPVIVYSLHPTTPRLPGGVERQQEDYRAIIAMMTAEPEGTTMIVGGDFNATPASDLFLGLMSATGMAVLAGDTVGIPTRFARELGMPTWIGVAIDHVTGRGPIVFRGRVVGPDIGSDHLPVLVDLEIGGAP